MPSRIAHFRPLVGLSVGALWPRRHDGVCSAGVEPPQRVTAVVSQHGVRTPVVLDALASDVYARRSGSSSLPKKSSRSDAVELPYCRYVVVGAGAAGRAAADTLRTLDPAGCSSGGLLVLGQSPPQHLLSATRVHPAQRRVDLSDGSAVRYGALLVATGSGPTDLAAGLADVVEPEARPLVRPLHSSLDRAALLEAAAQGLPVLVVGGSWPAVQLAADAADAARTMKKQPRVTLVCPEAAPLAKALPRFLASSVGQRLVARGVVVQPYTLVRYITPAAASNSNDAVASGDDASSSSLSPLSPASCVDVFTCRTFDALDTGRLGFVAMVAVAEHAASLATRASDAAAVLFNLGPEDTSPGGDGSGGSGGSDGTDGSGGGLVEWHSALGGVVVNAELQCCSGVWACGDAAVFPHPAGLGRCRGRGADAALHSGVVAARNMVATTAATQAERAGDGAVPWPYARAMGYRGTCAFLGLDFLALGRCDGDAETHSFFWGRHEAAAAAAASAVSVTRLRASPFYGPKAATAVATDSSGSDAAPPPTNAATTKAFGGKSGVVFYMDSSGARVVGVTLWNVPRPLSAAEASGGGATGPSRDAAAERAAAFARQLVVEHRGRPFAAASAASAAAALRAEGSSRVGGDAGPLDAGDAGRWPASSTPLGALERWYAQRPAERERLAAFTAKRALVDCLRDLAAEVASAATADETAAAHPGSGGASAPPPVNKLLADKLLGGGAYRHTPAKADRILLAATAAGSGGWAGEGGNGGGSSSGAAGLQGGGSSGGGRGHDRSAWVCAAAVGGEAPFTRGRHGRSAAAGKAEAYAAGLRGDVRTESGAHAQTIFHPAARG